jgi:hypothetical protein
MSLSPSLFDDLVPPEMWVTIGTIEGPEHDHVTVTIRLKEAGRRSISAKAQVTRYAPTASILLAVSKAVESLAVAQAPIDKKMLDLQLYLSVAAWVDPF